MIRVGVALVAVALVAGCSSSGGSVFAGGGSSSHAVIYYLSGTARSADLTLQLGPGGESQQRGVDVPVRNKNGALGLRFTASDGDFLYISAQNDGDGTLTCRITEDGTTVTQNTSSGEYSIVTCSGTA